MAVHTHLPACSFLQVAHRLSSRLISRYQHLGRQISDSEVIRDFPQSLQANTRTVHHIRYGRITSTKSPSFCMTTYTASPQILRSSYLSHMIVVITFADEYWHLQRTDCRNTLIYAHTNSRTLPTCDISLGSLTLPAPEAGDFVELILT
jgi:hypothetical protein